MALAPMKKCCFLIGLVLLLSDGTHGFSGISAGNLAVSLRGRAMTSNKGPAAVRMQLPRGPSAQPATILKSVAHKESQMQGSVAAPAVIAAAITLFPTGAFAAAPEWLEPVRSSLDIGLAILSLLFFLRIPISWYPQMDLNKAPQNIVAWPTEPACKLVRGLVQPLFGVDISPIVIYGVLSFIREIFLGQQGVLIMMANK